MKAFVPLKRRANVQYGLGQPPRLADDGVPIIRATNIYRGRIVADDLIRAHVEDLPLGRTPLLRSGEVLVVRSGAYTGDSALVTPEWAGSAPGYDLRLTPGPKLEPRFVAYTMLGRRVMDEVDLAKSRAAQPHLNAEDLGEVGILDTPISRQRLIADYLDHQTERIDALIAAKRRMVELLLEEEQRMLLNLVGDWRFEQTWSLRQSGTTVLTGPFGTQLAAADYVQNGIPVINPTHISRLGRIVPDNDVSVSESSALRLRRHRLWRGDIVMGRKGDVGRAALVEFGQEGWLCGSDSIAIRPDPTRLSPQFLAVVLQISLYRQQLDACSTGAMVANVNESTLLDFRIPRLSLARQEIVLTDIDRRKTARQRTSSCLVSSIDLLEERRQALITAAVTGQLNIPETT